MPVFIAAPLECDHEQTIGLTTATKISTRQRGRTLTLWCTECDEFHGFEPKGNPFEDD